MGHCLMRAWLKEESSGQAASALRRSPWVRGVFFETDEVKARAVAGLGRLFKKGCHCRQKVKTCAETCLTYHESVTIVVQKSRWQPVLLQKDIARFS